MSYFYTLRESDFSKKPLPQFYPWSANCLMEVSKYWKIVDFQKFQLKWKCKLFYEPQTARRLRKLFNLPPDKKLLTSLEQFFFLTEFYTNKQTCALQILRECSSWASRNGAVQIFLLTSTRNIVARTFVKYVTFLAVL